MPIVMALEIIREDLRKEAAEVIDIIHFSVVRAFGRFKKKNPQSNKSRQILFT
jgi:hypothetical protein